MHTFFDPFDDACQSNNVCRHAKRNTPHKRKKRKKNGNRRFVKRILCLLVMILFLSSFGPWAIQLLRTAAGSSEIDISGEVTQGKFPMFLQSDLRWASRTYGGSTMEISGCGPTCLSIVYCGLTGNDRWDPYSLASEADARGYYIQGSGTAWSMMTELAEEIGLNVHHVSFDADSITATLENGSPIICAMGPGDFTTEGHFIVLTGVSDNGKIIVRDPNSRINSIKTWPIDKLMPQIKNLWGYGM